MFLGGACAKRVFAHSSAAIHFLPAPRTGLPCPSGESGAHAKGGHATARVLEGFVEGSLKEVLLRRVLRRHLVRISTETEVLRRVLRRGGVL